MPFTTPSDADIVVDGFSAWLANGIPAIEFDGLPGVEYDTDTEWPVFIGPDVPAKPDQIIVITATGVSRVRATITQGVQVRLRGASWETAWQVRACAQAIVDYCTPNGFPRGHVNMGAFRAGTVLIRGHMPITSDRANRPEYVINLDIRYRKPLPIDGAPPFLPMPEPAVELTALEQHILDETPHPAYDVHDDLEEDLP